MLRWWLIFRWISEVHGDALAKLRLALVLAGVTLIVAFALH